MGSGIAAQIRKRFPEAYEIDKRTVSGDRSKLGQVSVATVTMATGRELHVVNAYTQYGTANPDNPHPLDYKAVRSCFRQIARWAVLRGFRVGIPKIGAGLAGGDWLKIEMIIENEMDGIDVTVVEYNKE